MCKGVRDVGARAALTCWPGGQKFDSASGRNWKTIDIGRQLDSLNSVTGKIHGIVKATHHLHMYTSPTECRLTIHLTHWKIMSWCYVVGSIHWLTIVIVAMLVTLFHSFTKTWRLYELWATQTSGSSFYSFVTVILRNNRPYSFLLHALWQKRQDDLTVA